MKTIGSHISYKDHGQDKTTLIITPKRQKWKDILLIFWLLAFTGVGVYIFFQLFGDYTREQKLTLFVFLSFWLYFEYRIGRALLWILAGQEFIKFTPGECHIKKAIGKYGKMRRYFLDNMGPFEQIQRKETSFGLHFENSYWVVGGETICFTYRNKVIALARKLEDQEINKLIKVLQSRKKKFKN